MDFKSFRQCNLYLTPQKIYLHIKTKKEKKTQQNTNPLVDSTTIPFTSLARLQIGVRRCRVQTARSVDTSAMQLNLPVKFALPWYSTLILIIVGSMMNAHKSRTHFKKDIYAPVLLNFFNQLIFFFPTENWTVSSEHRKINTFLFPCDGRPSPVPYNGI